MKKKKDRGMRHRRARWYVQGHRKCVTQPEDEKWSLNPVP